VRKFHSTFYRPDNATLVVVGDFDPKQLDAWVDKYFGVITKPSAPLPRVQVTEPARTAEKRFTEYGPNVPLPAVGLTYLVPSMKAEDAPALMMLDVLLSRGRSSRLYQALVYQQQIAQSASSGAALREDLGTFELTAIVAAGKKPEEAESALRAEIKKVKEALVGPAELEKAKNQILTGQLRQRETNNGKAQSFAEAAVLYGDPNRVNTHLAKLQSVTAADVQRVAQKYLRDDNAYVFYYFPESEKPKTGSLKLPANREGQTVKGGAAR
jgi:zinc protease